MKRAKLKLVRFELEWVDGRRKVVEFRRADKIADLLDDRGNLGEFLRDVVADAPEPR